MDFDKNRLFHIARAVKAPVGYFGYFANDLASIKKAVASEKQGKKSVYSRLDYILKDTEERRFGCPVGNFALFYVIGDNYNNSLT